MSVVQAIVTVEDHTWHGLHHVAVLDPEKSYDRLDRKLLVEVAGKWLNPALLNMVRRLIFPLRVNTKGDPTILAVHMTRGIQQGAPSSPVLSTVYTESLADDLRAATPASGDS